MSLAIFRLECKSVWHNYYGYVLAHDMEEAKRQVEESGFFDRLELDRASEAWNMRLDMPGVEAYAPDDPRVLIYTIKEIYSDANMIVEYIDQWSKKENRFIHATYYDKNDCCFKDLSLIGAILHSFGVDL